MGAGGKQFMKLDPSGSILFNKAAEPGSSTASINAETGDSSFNSIKTGNISSNGTLSFNKPNDPTFITAEINSENGSSYFLHTLDKAYVYITWQSTDRAILNVEGVIHTKDMLVFNRLDVGVYPYDGPSESATPDWGGTFFINGSNGINTDPIYFQRFNPGPDRSTLKLVIGDNSQLPYVPGEYGVRTTSGDAFVIGATNYPGDDFIQRFTFTSNGKLGIGTDAPQAELDIKNATNDAKFCLNGLCVTSLAPAAVAAIPGPQGEAGPQGPAGATGPQGPAGPSTADSLPACAANQAVTKQNGTVRCMDVMSPTSLGAQVAMRAVFFDARTYNASVSDANYTPNKNGSWEDYNWIIHQWVATMPYETDRAAWRAKCLVNGGQIPDYNADPIGFEYCGRAVCAAITGKWPFMARLQDACNEGSGSPGCNYGRFHLSFACLSAM
jgi:hypothetical protein